MAWAEIILYVTAGDAEQIRQWINADTSIAWIVAASRSGTTYLWKAVDTLDQIQPQEYGLWLKTGARLSIPSGSSVATDAEVMDPFKGWTQVLERDDATCPWFGMNLPGPYNFRFRENGSSTPEALGRSGFSWAADHYRGIGKGANPEAKRWWEKLRKFVKENAVPLAWPPGSGRLRAYAFKEAHQQIAGGRSFDVNP